MRRQKAITSDPASLTATGVFDPVWYRNTYLRASDWTVTPEFHFKAEGAWRGHWPNRFFDTQHYLDRFPELRASGIDPLTHYLSRGEREGASPNAAFDPTWYAATYPSHRVHFWGAFAHFCAFGWRLELSTHAGQVDSLDQMICELRADGLFDPDVYRRLNPDVAALGIDPIRHYVEYGSREGRQPHPLFDVDFYRDQITSRQGRDDNVLWHYARLGSAIDLNPNAWFDSTWYKRQYTHLMRPYETPVSHYMRAGGYLTNPSMFFDAIRYRRSYGYSPSRLDPLSDFVLDGMDQGRSTFTIDNDTVARLRAPTAQITCLKQASLGRRPTALLVTFASGGRIKGHVPFYAEALRKRGIDVVLIVAAPGQTAVIPTSLLGSCTAVYMRQNIGFDFAAWAHIINEQPSVLNSPIIYFTNDSIVGPIDEAGFTNVLQAIDTCEEDVVGLTDNRFYAWHLQSFFLAVKRSCLASDAFRDFWRDVVNRTSKDAVIRAYELTFTGRLTAAGFSAKALFPMETRDVCEGNRTILRWKDLVERGMPFVKASLLIGEHRAAAEADVRAFLREHGFDTSYFDATFEHAGPMSAIRHT